MLWDSAFSWVKKWSQLKSMFCTIRLTKGHINTQTRWISCNGGIPVDLTAVAYSRTLLQNTCFIADTQLWNTEGQHLPMWEECTWPPILGLHIWGDRPLSIHSPTTHPCVCDISKHGMTVPVVMSRLIKKSSTSPFGTRKAVWVSQGNGSKVKWQEFSHSFKIPLSKSPIVYTTHSIAMQNERLLKWSKIW